MIEASDPEIPFIYAYFFEFVITRISRVPHVEGGMETLESWKVGKLDIVASRFVRKI